MKNSIILIHTKLVPYITSSLNVQMLSINKFSFTKNIFQVTVLLTLLAFTRGSPVHIEMAVESNETQQPLYKAFQMEVSLMDSFPNDTFEPPSCSSETDCTQNRSYTVCVDNACHCQPNYRYIYEDKINIICSPFRCQRDADCQDWDPNLVCTSERTCACRREFYSSNHLDQKCVQMAPGFNWLLYLTIIPILLVIALSVYLCIRLGRSSSKSLRERATDFKRRMSRKFSVIAGVSSKNAASDNNNNNNIISSKENGKLPRPLSQTDM